MSKQVIKLSNNAAARIKIMSEVDNSAIGVRVGGQLWSKRMSYVLEYAKEVKPNEEVIDEKGVKVIVDPNAIIYLLGTEMIIKRKVFFSIYF